MLHILSHTQHETWAERSRGWLTSLNNFLRVLLSVSYSSGALVKLHVCVNKHELAENSFILMQGKTDGANEGIKR